MAHHHLASVGGWSLWFSRSAPPWSIYSRPVGFYHYHNWGIRQYYLVTPLGRISLEYMPATGPDPLKQER